MQKFICSFQTELILAQFSISIPTENVFFEGIEMKHWAKID